MNKRIALATRTSIRSLQRPGSPALLYRHSRYGRELADAGLFEVLDCDGWSARATKLLTPEYMAHAVQRTFEMHSLELFFVL